MTKPDLIIFDCDGVLVDSEVLSCRCLSEVLAGYVTQVWTRLDLLLDEARRPRPRDTRLGRSILRAIHDWPRQSALRFHCFFRLKE